MMKVWQVVLVGCHPTSMLGTKLILEEGNDLKVIGMCSNWTEGSAMVKDKLPDLAILDYSMPDGTVETVLAELKDSSPSTHYVIMTDNDGMELIQPLMGMGASGIISKSASPSQLLHMIGGLQEGFMSMPLDWLNRGLWPVSSVKGNDGVLQLTQTEKFIMDRIVQGVTYDKIALEIQVSRRSIDNYLRKIYVKLDVSTRAQAIEKYALYSRVSRQMYA